MAKTLVLKSSIYNFTPVLSCLPKFHTELEEHTFILHINSFTVLYVKRHVCMIYCFSCNRNKLATSWQKYKVSKSLPARHFLNIPIIHPHFHLCQLSTWVLCLWSGILGITLLIRCASWWACRKLTVIFVKVKCRSFMLKNSPEQKDNISSAKDICNTIKSFLQIMKNCTMKNYYTMKVLTFFTLQTLT